MMHNLTRDGETTSSIFSRYLLGESYKNILLRLTTILCSILIIWFGLMVTLIFFIRHQRRKHLQSLLESHFHLYGSKLNLTSNQYKELKRRSQYHSPKRPHSVMKARPASNYVASVRRAPAAMEKTKLVVNVNHTHAIIKAMTKPPLVFNEKVSTTTAVTEKVDTPSPKTNHLQSNESKKRPPTATPPNVPGNTFSVTCRSTVEKHSASSFYFLKGNKNRPATQLLVRRSDGPLCLA